MKLEQLISVLFYAGMACWFLYAFFFPVESDYWLMRNGIPVMFIEFLTPFIALSLATLLRKETFWTWSHKLLAFAFLAVLLFLAFAITDARSNLWLFGYLMLSAVIKFLGFRSFADIRSEATEVLILMTFSISFAATALLLSVFSILFPVQRAAQLEFYYTTLPTSRQSSFIYGNPGFIALWGFLYFIFLALRPFMPEHWTKAPLT